jgi:soluble lytic murein transglycosylase
MIRFSLFALAISASAMATASVPLAAQAGASEAARMQLVARAPTRISAAVDQWKFLSANDRMDFGAYAGFVLAYPDFPRLSIIRTHAEEALERDAVPPEQLAAYFDRQPPLTNPARARYALALAALQRPEAPEVARAAWRGGDMSGPAEAYLLGLYGSKFTPADHEARMDALLWQGKAEAALRQINNVDGPAKSLAMARLALIQNEAPSSAAIPVPANAASDPGYVYNLTRYYRRTGQGYRALELLANRPQFARPAFEADDMVSEMLMIARSGGASNARAIASKIDDLFPPNTDISTKSYRLRDDYTSLMWLGGTKALWQLGDGRGAAPLFYRYGAAARTPQTRSKGFYWAGLASFQAGDTAEAQRYWNMAAQYGEYFYGLLALDRLGRPLPEFAQQPQVQISAAQRAEFMARPVVQAVRDLASGRTDWRTERYFFTHIAEQAQTPEEMYLAAQVAQELHLPEMAVVIGRTAPEKDFTGFERIGFPTVSTPPATNWTMIHAISRQESEFDETRVSHAGARGLMQLMPGTAREQADKLGMSYMSANLISDPQYNIRLGDGYFARMMDYYGGSYPLAVAAYNAGPGNVNKWLRANGDPRQGTVEWTRWIEEIPIFETKNYVQRVLENAVVYEAMHPDKAAFGRPRGIRYFIR